MSGNMVRAEGGGIQAPPAQSLPTLLRQPELRGNPRVDPSSCSFASSSALSRCVRR